MIAPTEMAVTVLDPDGNEQEITLAIDWVRESNPKDKEERMYRGEDDGWIVESVGLAE
mgnify:FL=1